MKRKSKIIISQVSDSVNKMKGFSGGPFGGCLRCPCGEKGQGDVCCRYGCDTDLESMELIEKQRKTVEAELGDKLENCYVGGVILDKEYLGGGYRRTKVGDDGFCIFHSRSGRGCMLARMVIENGLSWRTLPTICRIYPLTWENGVMGTYPEIVGEELEIDCDCIRVGNKTHKTVWETQKEHVLDCFELVARAEKGVADEALEDLGKVDTVAMED